MEQGSVGVFAHSLKLSILLLDLDKAKITFIYKEISNEAIEIIHFL
jgi:hypothetical protein